MSFHVGQKVVCVDARPLSGTIWYDGEKLAKGQTYTLARIFLDYLGDEVVWLCETERVQNHPGEIGYGIYRFRPVRTTSINIFTKMLVPAPKHRAKVGARA